MKRRIFLKSALATYATTLGGSALAQAASADVDYEEIDAPFREDQLLYGTNPASAPEDKRARQILEAAPKGKSLIETATYFANLTEKNDKGWFYNAQWPNTPGAHWNPVLIGFYQHTSMSNKQIFAGGDTTAWCAAFMNWCLLQSGYKPTASNSAMSGAYRDYGNARKPGETAVAGDIIVFKRIDDPAEGNAGHGHVTIFLAEDSFGYDVLGGNQKAGKKYSSVNKSRISKSSSILGLHSIRDISGMKRV